MPAWEANYYIKYQMFSGIRNDSSLRSRGLKVIQIVVVPKERSERGRETCRKTEAAPAREAHENRTKNKTKQRNKQEQSNLFPIIISSDSSFGKSLSLNSN